MAHVIIRTAKSLEAGLCSTRCPVEESIILSSPFLKPTTIKFPIYVNDTKKSFPVEPRTIVIPTQFSSLEIMKIDIPNSLTVTSTANQMI